MTDELHERARQLVAQARIEGLSADERRWLEEHLESCADCAGFAGGTDRALRALRSVPVEIDPELIKRTRLLVEFRAHELAARRSALLPLWVCCGLSWLLGILSAPLVWKAFEWLGHAAGVPKLVWQAGFVLWWILPVAAVAAILAIPKPGRLGAKG